VPKISLQNNELAYKLTRLLMTKMVVFSYMAEVVDTFDTWEINTKYLKVMVQGNLIKLVCAGKVQ
jgi:hypothetical protein